MSRPVRLQQWAGGCGERGPQKEGCNHEAGCQPCDMERTWAWGHGAWQAHLPTCRPPKMKEMARLRCSVGMARATTSVAAEGATPSPSPTAARDRKRPGSVPASRGTPAVAAAQGGSAVGREW